MADYFGATLQFPAHLITPEIKAMIEEYVQEHDAEFNTADGICTLYAGEARWGQFEEIEDALVTAAIPFNRETEQYYSDPSFTTYFRPGITQEPVPVDDLVEVGEIKRLLREGGLMALQAYLENNFPDFPALETRQENEVT